MPLYNVRPNFTSDTGRIFAPFLQKGWQIIMAKKKLAAPLNSVSGQVIAALYVRVSTLEQAKEGYSIGEQEDRLKAYAAAHGWTVYKTYCDPGHSGATLDRPAMQDMLRDVKAGKVNMVVVYKLDRLSRSQKDTLYLIEDAFNANGVDFTSMQDALDTSTPIGRAMLGVLATFAQFERENIKERMKMGKEGRAKKGLTAGTIVVHTGYNYVDGHLVVNEYEKMQILEATDLILQGKSVSSVVKLFNQKGYTQKHGIWSPTLLQRVLRSRVILGEIRFDGEWYPGIHEPLMSEDQFDAVNQKLDIATTKFTRTGTRPGAKYQSILSGLVFCARCGARYSRKKTSPTRIYYTCGSVAKKSKPRVKDPNCKNPSWRMEKLDDLILSEIKKLALDPGYFEILKEKPDHSDNGEILNSREILKDQITKLDGQIEKLMDLYSIGGIPIDSLTKKIQSLHDQKEKLQLELDKSSLSEENQMDREEVVEIISKLDKALASDDIDEIRNIIGQLIDKITIDGEDVTIYWQFNNPIAS
jgi:site-specific DNA recombinase